MGDFGFRGMIERLWGTARMESNRNGLLRRGAGKRLNPRHRGKRQLHASAMMAAYLVLAMLKAAGALIMIRYQRIDTLGLGVVMLDVRGMGKCGAIPCEHDEQQPTPEEQLGNRI